MFVIVNYSLSFVYIVLFMNNLCKIYINKWYNNIINDSLHFIIFKIMIKLIIIITISLRN